MIKIEISKYNDKELLEMTNEKLDAKNISQWEKAVFSFMSSWLSGGETVEVRTSGTTGEPGRYHVSKEAMLVSAKKTLDFFQLKQGDKALLCLSPAYIAGKLMIVRALAGELSLIIREPSSTPLDGIDEEIDFAAMVPMQVQTQMREDPFSFTKLKKLIIGGSGVSSSLIDALQDITTEVWETYGMTETLTHIALKRINGPDKSEWFSPLPGVHILRDGRKCLVTEVEGITDRKIKTNDIVEFNGRSQFRVKGRIDDIINTGGIKVVPLTVEEKLEQWISSPYVISSVPDKILGEKLVLVIEGEEYDTTVLRESLQTLKFYEVPKEIVFTRAIPRTETGKVKRAEVRKTLARTVLMPNDQKGVQ